MKQIRKCLNEIEDWYHGKSWYNNNSKIKVGEWVYSTEALNTDRDIQDRLSSDIHCFIFYFGHVIDEVKPDKPAKYNTVELIRYLMEYFVPIMDRYNITSISFGVNGICNKIESFEFNQKPTWVFYENSRSNYIVYEYQ